MDQKVSRNRESPKDKKTGIATVTGTHSWQESASKNIQHTVSNESIAATYAPLVSTSSLPIKLIPIEAVCEMLGLKRSATLGMVADGIIPRPIKFGTSRRAAARWIEQEIVDFIMKKAAERDITTTHSRRKEVAE